MFWSQFKKTRKELSGMPISAKAVVKARGGKVLVLRKVGRSLYDLPGGKIERGEDMFQGLAREIREETGLKVDKFHFLASWIKQNPGFDPRLMIVFRTSLKKQPNKCVLSLSEEHDWGRFVGPSKAVHLPMDAGYKNAVALACKKRLRV